MYKNKMFNFEKSRKVFLYFNIILCAIFSSACTDKKIQEVKFCFGSQPVTSNIDARNICEKLDKNLDIAYCSEAKVAINENVASSLNRYYVCDCNNTRLINGWNMLIYDAKQSECIDVSKIINNSFNETNGGIPVCSKIESKH